jgi:hypothetical protein
MAKSSGAGGPLLVLLLILCGAMGWNYKRNTDAESTLARPYRGYSDNELEQLKTAQQSDADARHAVYRAGSRRVTIQNRGLLGDRVDEFERVQKASAQHRERSHRVSESQAAISLIEAEQATRELDRPIYKLIIRRTFTFRPI